MSEQEPKKFPAELRIVSGKNRRENWEDVTNGPVEAYMMWAHFLMEFEKAGIKIDKNTKILEVGSGRGALLGYLRDQGLDVVGVDVRPRTEQVLPVAQARIEQLPFKDEQFDLVVSSFVFDPGAYAEDQNLMLREIQRVLKIGGVYAAAWERVSSYPKELSKIGGSGAFNIYKKV